MTTPFEIADRLTESYSDLAPILATTYGIAGRDDLWDDLSPDGEAAKADLREKAMTELVPHLDHDDPVQAHTAKILVSYLGTLNERYRSGHWKQDINHIYSPFQRARDTFDVVSMDGPEAWEAVVTRLSTLDQLLSGYRASLQLGIDEGETVARRQVSSLIEQVRSGGRGGITLRRIP